MRGSLPASPSVPTEGQPISNARLAAELQGLAIAIHMFGLDGLANMSAERAYETPENEHVDPTTATQERSPA